MKRVWNINCLVLRIQVVTSRVYTPAVLHSATLCGERAQLLAALHGRLACPAAEPCQHGGLRQDDGALVTERQRSLAAVAVGGSVRRRRC